MPYLRTVFVWMCLSILNQCLICINLYCLKMYSFWDDFFFSLSICFCEHTLVTAVCLCRCSCLVFETIMRQISADFKKNTRSNLRLVLQCIVWLKNSDPAALHVHFLHTSGKINTHTNFWRKKTLPDQPHGFCGHLWVTERVGHSSLYRQEVPQYRQALVPEAFGSSLNTWFAPVRPRRAHITVGGFVEKVFHGSYRSFLKCNASPCYNAKYDCRIVSLRSVAAEAFVWQFLRRWCK